MIDSFLDKFELCDVEFYPGGRTYSYLAENDCYSVGDLVVVNAGKDNHEATVRIVTKKPYELSTSQIPAEQMKHILRLANEEEKGAFAKPHHLKPKKKKPLCDYSKVESNDSTYVAEGMQPDGSFVISYSDSYEGMDVEVNYNLDPENTEKLRAVLSKRYKGSLETMLIQECGYGYREKGLSELFDEIGLKYGHFTWIS